MKVRQTNDGKVLVFPEGREFRAFKRWMLEFGNPADDYYDSTAGCYVIKSTGIKELEIFGFKLEKMNRKQYGTMVAKDLHEGYYQNGEGE